MSARDVSRYPRDELYLHGQQIDLVYVSPNLLIFPSMFVFLTLQSMKTNLETCCQILSKLPHSLFFACFTTTDEKEPSVF